MKNGWRAKVRSAELRESNRLFLFIHVFFSFKLWCTLCDPIGRSKQTETQRRRENDMMYGRRAGQFSPRQRDRHRWSLSLCCCVAVLLLLFLFLYRTEDGEDEVGDEERKRESECAWHPLNPSWQSLRKRQPVKDFVAYVIRRKRAQTTDHLWFIFAALKKSFLNPSKWRDTCLCARKVSIGFTSSTGAASLFFFRFRRLEENKRISSNSICCHQTYFFNSFTFWFKPKISAFLEARWIQWLF